MVSVLLSAFCAVLTISSICHYKAWNNKLQAAKDEITTAINEAAQHFAVAGWNNSEIEYGTGDWAYDNVEVVTQIVGYGAVVEVEFQDSKTVDISVDNVRNVVRCRYFESPKDLEGKNISLPATLEFTLRLKLIEYNGMIGFDHPEFVNNAYWLPRIADPDYIYDFDKFTYVIGREVRKVYLEKAQKAVMAAVSKILNSAEKTSASIRTSKFTF